MFKKSYIGHHGLKTFVRGVWCENEEGELSVRVTRIGNEDDEIRVGDVLTLDEINGITEGDVFGYCEAVSKYSVV